MVANRPFGPFWIGRGPSALLVEEEELLREVAADVREGEGEHQLQVVVPLGEDDLRLRGRKKGKRVASGTAYLRIILLQKKPAGSLNPRGKMIQLTGSLK